MIFNFVRSYFAAIAAHLQIKNSQALRQLEQNAEWLAC